MTAGGWRGFLALWSIADRARGASQRHTRRGVPGALQPPSTVQSSLRSHDHAGTRPDLILALRCSSSSEEHVEMGLGRRKSGPVLQLAAHLVMASASSMRLPAHTHTCGACVRAAGARMPPQPESRARARAPGRPRAACPRARHVHERAHVRTPCERRALPDMEGTARTRSRRRAHGGDQWAGG